MVRRDKSSSGRVTPKGTGSGGRIAPGRQPVTIEQRSSIIVPILMFGLLAVGLLVILLNYLGAFGDPSNWYLMIGLGLILGGIVAATQYR